MFNLNVILYLYHHLSQISASVEFCPSTTSSATVCKETFPWQNVRLPTYYKPTHYDLFVKPNLTTGEFNGAVTINMIVNSNPNVDISSSKNWLILHVDCLNISKIHVYTTKNSPAVIQEKDIQYCEAFNQLALKMPKFFGNKFSLHLAFHGIMTNSSERVKGLSLNEYEVKERSGGNTSMKKLVITHFQPSLARKMFPCFDEPSFKATFTVSIAREMHMRTLSNAKMRESRSIKENSTLVKDLYESSPKMSTYLLALAVYDSGTFKRKTSKSKSGVWVSIYAPVNKIKLTYSVLNVAIRALDFMTNFFNIPYPLDKLDFIYTLNLPADGVENWGLVTILNYTMELDDPSLDVIEKEGNTRVIVHEVAHQWFGNLVTMEWYDDLWLNEGFASFMEIYVTEILFPEYDVMSNFLSAVEQLMVDNHAKDSTVSMKITNEVKHDYYQLSYKKGAFMIRSLLYLIGLENLKKGFQTYIRNYQYLNAKAADLWSSLQKFKKNIPPDLTIGEYMANFIKKPGFPLVEVSIRNGVLYANQTRFYNSLVDFKNMKKEETWNIPLTIKTEKSDKTITYWLKKEQREISVKTNLKNIAWFKANVDKSGYYRVNYDANNWVALFNSVAKNPKILSQFDKIDLLSNAFALLKLGKSNIVHIFNFLKGYLPEETSLTAWKIVDEHTKYIEKRLRGSTAYANYMCFMAKLLEKPYKKYGPSSKSVNYHRAKLIQPKVVQLACHFNVSDCQQKPAKRFLNFLEKGVKGIENEQITNRLCQNFVKIYKDRYQEVVELFKKNRGKGKPMDEMYYMICLASSPSHINQFKALLLNETEVNDHSSLYFGMLGAIDQLENGLSLMWDFLDQNFDNLKKRLKFNTDVELFQEFQTKDDIIKLKRRFANEPNTKSAVDKTIRTIEMNVQFMEFNEAALINYFKNQCTNDKQLN